MSPGPLKYFKIKYKGPPEERSRLEANKKIKVSGIRQSISGITWLPSLCGG
jgi:hypothetical protein